MISIVSFCHGNTLDFGLCISWGFVAQVHGVCMFGFSSAGHCWLSVCSSFSYQQIHFSTKWKHNQHSLKISLSFILFVIYPVTLYGNNRQANLFKFRVRALLWTDNLPVLSSCRADHLQAKQSRSKRWTEYLSFPYWVLVYKLVKERLYFTDQ